MLFFKCCCCPQHLISKPVFLAGAACPPLRWERMPRELHPSGLAGRTKKKKAAASSKTEAKQAKVVVDIADKLERLEKMDEKEKSDDEEAADGGE
jgi:hypothetical protein